MAIINDTCDITLDPPDTFAVTDGISNIGNSVRRASAHSSNIPYNVIHLPSSPPPHRRDCQDDDSTTAKTTRTHGAAPDV